MHPVFQPGQWVFRPFLAFHLCGLAVLPFCLLTDRRRDGNIFLYSFAAMSAGCVYFYFFNQGLPYGGMFPYCGGMLSLNGAFSDGLVVGHRDILLGPVVRMVLTLLGCVGGAEILAALVERWRTKNFTGTLLWFTGLQLLILLIIPDLNDRYLEVLFPGAIFLVAQKPLLRPTGGWPAWRRLILSGVISISLMHDWLAWNSVRWELGREAVASKLIEAGEIEGGFEWNGWYATADFNKPLPRRGTQPSSGDAGSLDLCSSRALFSPDVTGRFALAFTPPENGHHRGIVALYTEAGWRVKKAIFCWSKNGHRQ